MAQGAGQPKSCWRGYARASTRTRSLAAAPDSDTRRAWRQDEALHHVPEHREPRRLPLRQARVSRTGPARSACLTQAATCAASHRLSRRQHPRPANHCASAGPCGPSLPPAYPRSQPEVRSSAGSPRPAASAAGPPPGVSTDARSPATSRGFILSARPLAGIVCHRLAGGLPAAPVPA